MQEIFFRSCVNFFTLPVCATLLHRHALLLHLHSSHAFLYSWTVRSFCIKDADEGSTTAQPSARLLPGHGLYAGAPSERLPVWFELFLQNLLPEESKLRAQCPGHMNNNGQLTWSSVVDCFLFLAYLMDCCVSRRGTPRLVGLLVTSWTWAASCHLRACPWERLCVQEPGACSSSCSLSCSS